MKKTHLFFALLAIALCGSAVLAPPARAQFIGYTSPQTTQAILATNVACTGSAQLFTTGVTPKFNNIGQTQHYATISVTGTTQLTAEIDGLDVAGNVYRLSDVLESAAANLPLVITGSGYFPKIRISVTCSPGSATFTLSYSGTSSTANVSTGSYLLAQIDKTIANGSSASTTITFPTFQSPFGNASGTLLFAVGAGAAAGSNLQVVCIGNSFSFSGPYIFPLATSIGVQPFVMPNVPCPIVQIEYSSGGSSAAIYNLEYLFTPPAAPPATAANLISTFNLAPALTEKGSRWSVFNSPGTGAASASKAANATPGRHVADCVSFSAVSSGTAPTANVVNINLRDGASGAGTILYTWEIGISPTTGATMGLTNFCGLNLIGSPNTAMTLEFTGGVTNVAQTVALSGYDVQ